jgi:hypothetical protein
MNAWFNVVRYHLVDRVNYLLIPVVILAFAFLVDVPILAMIPGHHHGSRYVGGLASIFVFQFALGLLSVNRSLPFGLTLGISRRTYYLGTIAMAIGLAAVFSLAVTVLQAIERSTNGWGISMGFFRVPYILDGAWYTTWATSLVAMVLMFVWGTWFGLVFRRWGVAGMIALIAGQITVGVVAAGVVTWTRTWHGVGHFFTTIHASGLTGVLALVAAALVVGALTTLRGLTV